MKNQWNLKTEYKRLTDPNIEKDVRKIERAYRAFEKKYKDNTSYLKNNSELKKALDDYEGLYVLPKPLSFLFLSKAIDTNNKQIDAKIALMEQRIVRAANNVVFFKISLGALPDKRQSAILKDTELAEYRYFLKQVFERGKHMLTEEENKLLGELSLPANDMWIDLTERLQSERVVEFRDMKVPLSAATGLLSTLESRDRRALWGTIRDEFKADSAVAEAELNALYTTKAVLDRKRGYKEPFDETLLNFETTKKELRALREAVLENQDISHVFYEFKRDTLRLKTLTYADRNAELGSFKREFSYEESKDILLNLFKESHPRFHEVLKEMIKNRRIDAFPRLGKTSGAFCSGNIEFPTFVLLNHVNTFDSLSTFAHEMGHAIHTELAKTERPLYQGYSTATAEFASTFFEELLFNELMPTLSGREQRLLLHSRINRDVSTIFRQMAFFEFEIALHEEVRSTGYVPKERIAELLNIETSKYMGHAVTLEPDDGYFFVPLSHIRRSFYVYSYAYGGLLSRLISRRALENPEFFESVVGLLSSGSSASPKELFARLGIHTERKKTFGDALAVIREDLNRLRGAE